MTVPQAVRRVTRKCGHKENVALWYWDPEQGKLLPVRDPLIIQGEMAPASIRVLAKQRLRRGLFRARSRGCFHCHQYEALQLQFWGRHP